jgi:NTP pyrophosphatase (non-canonical NTP hydrolase)
MVKDELEKLMIRVFAECNELREAGQKEYVGGEDAFGNFNRLASELGISRESVLWIDAMKHKDGIASYIRGHKSQREDVRGKINDLIVYLCILRGMIEESTANDLRPHREDFMPQDEKEIVRRERYQFDMK